MASLKQTMRRAFNRVAVSPRQMAAMALTGFIASVGVVMPVNGAEAQPLSPHLQAAQQLRGQNILSSHALTVFGNPKYRANFRSFDYVNPDAPKGGTLSTGASGTFDSLNPFIIRGNAAQNLMLIYDTLMTPSTDETGSSYGLLAGSVDVPEDKSWITFHLRPEARWQDGQPVTADDVKWTFDTLRDQAVPGYAANWRDVSKVEVLDNLTIKFTLSHPNARLTLVTIAQMPVLPKHYWAGLHTEFRDSTNVMPMGSGPYKISNVNLGNTITYERVKDWWGKDLAVNRGRYNFDNIRIEYFRDENSQLEAFATGLYNFRMENTAMRWAISYDRMPRVQSGQILREAYPNDLPAGMQCYVFNSRRGPFTDVRVRKAIEILFNFEWENRVMAYDAYKRTRSYFTNSDLESSGLPTGRELQILERYRGRIPDSVFTNGDRPPVYEPFFSGEATRTDGLETERSALRKAFNLLKDAGYVIRDMKMVNARTGQPLTFEMVTGDPGFTRWILPYFETIKRLGITPTLRVVDSSQYVNRIQSFDYDMAIAVFRQPMTPGPEQRNYWSSEAANQPGSANLARISDPVVDELVEMMQQATTREELQASAKALDRVLLSGHYVVPHYHTGTSRIAYDKELKHKSENLRPRYEMNAFTDWWIDAKKPGPALKPK